MGLFGKIFDKKECAICGGEIGLMGNKKLADGNMCKECAAKLSPWFSERKQSTVEEIKEQLAYREENLEAVRAFNTTRSIGKGTKVLIDEDAGKFAVTSARDLEKDNPDILDFTQVTGVDIDVNESRMEEKRKDKEGKMVSYVPPRFKYSYSFYAIIRVNHPYFDTMKFSLSNGSISINPRDPVPESRKPDPGSNLEFRECEEMGRELKQTLTQSRQRARREAAQANAPKAAVTCPWCGATTTPNASGCCEYCGGALNG
ncbi:MAG: DUF4428 domain-containing protein [Lachnospiraceae bacterium]|nr:DUF4428 domain-containing protein [Lachnospiraceae bacterium]